MVRVKADADVVIYIAAVSLESHYLFEAVVD